MLSSVLVALIDRALLTPMHFESLRPVEKATVKFSALMTAMKGKVGGTVFQGSKVGSIVKNKPNGNFVKAIPWLYGDQDTVANWSGSMQELLSLSPGMTASDGSNSAWASTPRPQQTLKLLSKIWGTLESSDRAAWNSAAPNFPFTNRFGESYVASGYQVFVAINAKLMNLGQSMQTLPPSPSDGDLATWVWNTIYINTNPTFADFLQLQVPDGICPGAVVVVKSSVQQSAGKLKTVFGGKGQIVLDEDEGSTVELLPLFNRLFGNASPGAAVFFTVDVINLSNAHTVYTAEFQVLIPEVESDNLISRADAGRSVLGGAYLPNFELDWLSGNGTYAFGNVSIVSEANPWHVLLKGIQLPPNSNVLFTPAGDIANDFAFYIAGSDDALLTAQNFPTDQYGKLYYTPVVTRFHPTTLGAKSATVTISHPSMAAPIVLTFTGTGI